MRILVFLIGTIIGSFLALCIYRIPKGIDIIFKQSYCEHCKKKIRIRDLIPIISYVSLKGKARCCNKKISKKNIIIELLTGIIFLLLFIKYDLSFLFFKYSIFMSLMTVIAFIDLETSYVYTSVILKGSIIGVFLIVFEKVIYDNKILDYVIGAFLVGFIMFLISKITKGAIGEGDIYIIFLIGLFLGCLKTMELLMITFMIGGLIAAILLITKLKKKKDAVPLAPFLFLATFFIIFSQ